MMRSRSVSLRRTDLSPESRRQSSMSVRIAVPTKNRKNLRKTVTSILNERKNFHVIEDQIDVTPKNLVHSVYHSIDEHQCTAFDTICLGQGSSHTNLCFPSSASEQGNLRMSSMFIIKSSSIQMPQTQQFMEDMIIGGSFASYSASAQMEDDAPSQFCLPRYNSSSNLVLPSKLNITLRETETFFIYHLPQLTVDLSTEEGMAVNLANQQYQNMAISPESNRKLANAEAQTPCIYRKSRGTYLGRSKRKNQGTFVNNWVIHDTYCRLNLEEIQDTIVSDTDEAREKALAKQVSLLKLPSTEGSLENLSPDEQMAYLAEHTNFLDALFIIERIIASNLFIVAQKRFKGLIKQDPYSPSLQFTYSLDWLWSYKSPLIMGATVSCFAWNHVNKDILAAAYGPIRNFEGNQGLIMIWTAKNPQKCGRWWYFKSPISALDWSYNRPNLLAIGLYNGIVQIIDASSKKLVIIYSSSRGSSPSYGPHWQVQWWIGEEEVMFEEQLYTTNQDGRIFCYRTNRDFSCVEMMRINRTEGKIKGVKQPRRCVMNDVPITQNPGAMILRRHPKLSMIYFVGSDEGCIHRCSTTYLQRHIDVFLAHVGPVYGMQFSPYCSKIFLTCGADWCTRIWADGITEPLITLSTQMACVQSAAWSPKNSTIIATIVNNEIEVWDIKRKTYTPTSVTVCDTTGRLVLLEFTANGDQLVVADTHGVIHIYSLEGMPFPPYNQTSILVSSIRRALVTKPKLQETLKKLGKPF